jgi:hypothetical protein
LFELGFITFFKGTHNVIYQSISEIPDEDDREQITLWARQVVKGRLTESEFAERLKDINSNQT